MLTEARLALQQNTRGLMAAVSSLPELTERKRTIDKHTNLATALLAAIQARGLATFVGSGVGEQSSSPLLLTVT